VVKGVERIKLGERVARCPFPFRKGCLVGDRSMIPKPQDACALPGKEKWVDLEEQNLDFGD
jgi:hypothetical protein